MPYDAITISGYSIGGTTTIIAHPATILGWSATFNVNTTDIGGVIGSCDGGSPRLFGTGQGNQFTKGFELTHVICANTDFKIWENNSGQYYTITYIPRIDSPATTTSTSAGTGTSTTSTSGGYTGPNYHDWLLVAMVFLFFVSYPIWSKLFKGITAVFKKRNYNNNDEI